VTVGITAAALLASMLTIVGSTVAAPAAVASTPQVTERPDEVTAQMAARSQGSRVEVAGLHTESRRVWANPDGSFTSEVFPGQNWTMDAVGHWQEIDTTLVRDADGSVSPRAAAVEVTLAGPTSDQPGAVPIVTLEVAKASLGELAAAHEDSSVGAPAADEAGRSGASLTVATQGGLPAPELDGAEATYASFEPGRDLRVTVLPGGVETFVDLTTAPASIPAAGVEVALPLSVKGLTVAENGDGGLVIKDAKTGAVVGTTPQSRIWDASIDEVSGESKHGIVVDTQLRKTSSGYVVLATVPASYLATPGLTYPITVDPSATLPPSRDTYVEKGYNDTSFGSETDLKVGTYDSGTHVARSYLQFTISDAANLYDTAEETTVVDSAKLKLWEWHAASCTAAAMNIRYLTSPFTAADTTWNTKPTQSGAIYTVSDAHRDDSSGACAAGWFDSTSGTEVKSIVQGWADGDYTNYGFALTASETASSGWKRFYSGQYATAARRPSLVVTYHHIPRPATASVVNRTSAGWVSSATPTISYAPADLDGGSLAGKFYVSTSSTFSPLTWSTSKTTTSTVSVSAASSVLAQNTQYYARTQSQQGTESGAFSPPVAFRVDSLPPAVSIGCPLLPADAFTNPAPTNDVPCNASASDSASGVAAITVTLDGSTAAILSLSGSGANRSFNLAKGSLTLGGHELIVTATDVAGNVLAQAYRFGIGSAYLSSPAEAQSTSSGKTTLEVSAPSGVSAYIEYSTDRATWSKVPATQLQTLSGGPVSTPLPLVSAGGMVRTGKYMWDMGVAFPSDDAVVFIRPCVLATAQATCVPATSDNNITLDRTGVGAAETQVGPVSVALTTGAASLAETDGVVGGVSVGRTYNSYASAAVGPFGRGWSTSVDSAAGSAWTRVVETAGGALLYAAESGDPIGFTKLTGGGPCPEMNFEGPAEATELTLCKPAPSVYTLTEIDGPTTTFKLSSAATYSVAGVHDPDTGEDTVVNADGNGISRIIPPLRPGLAASSCPDDTTTWAVGCSDLVLSYNNNGRVVAVTWRGFEQPLDGGVPIKRTFDVACYRYDTTNTFLLQVWDPRDNTTGYAVCGTGAAPAGALTTTYTYDTLSRMNSVKAPGLRPWELVYEGSSGRVNTVSRTHLPTFNSGSTETTTIQYNVNIGAATAADSSHPDLTLSALGLWWPLDPQSTPVSAPVSATAVFQPGADTASLLDATVTAMDDQGRAVITAAYSGVGQQGWRIATQVLDKHTGAIVASLTPANRAAALDASSPVRSSLGLTGSSAEVARLLSSITVSEALQDDNADGVRDAKDTMDVTHAYGPLHLVDVGTGTVVAARTHVVNSFGSVPTSADSPTGALAESTARWHQIVQKTEGAFDPASNADIPGTVTTTKYAYAFTSNGVQDTSGWKFGAPTQTTVVLPGGTDIVKRVVLDPILGTATQQRQPSALNDDLVAPVSKGTHQTRTWKVGSFDASTCTASAWYGLPCSNGPASGSTPATTQTFYDVFQRSIKSVDTSAGISRTTQVAYANGGLSTRVATNSVTGGAPGDKAVPVTTVTYDGATGLPIGATATAGETVSTDSTYDDFGRPLTSNDGYQGQVISTYENTSGRLATVTSRDNGSTIGVSSYTYNGGQEHRGLPTRVTQSTVGDITGTYDADGALLTQTSPMGSGSLTGTWSRDTTGSTYELSWVATDWSVPVYSRVTIDAHGRATSETSNLFSTSGRQIAYVYDGADRLVGVTDRRASSCVSRSYAFDTNGNRTSTTNYPSAPDGTCQEASGTSIAASYDGADRPTDVGVAYDALNRTTSLPAAATSTPTSSPLAITYHRNDLVASITQTPLGLAAQRQEWTLDATNRLACRRDRPDATIDTSACGATTTGGVVDTRNHYEGGADSPSWSTRRLGGSTPTTSITWYAGGLGGNVHATVAGSTVTYLLANLHGDVPMTVSKTAASSPDGTPGDADEFGVVRDAAGAPTVGARYSWLGTMQRDASLLGGVVQMGVRLYAPMLGRFLSTDPQFAGNATTYGYSTDPINSADLTGRNTPSNGGPGGGGYCPCRVAVMGWIHIVTKRWVGWYAIALNLPSGNRVHYRTGETMVAIDVQVAISSGAGMVDVSSFNESKSRWMSAGQLYRFRLRYDASRFDAFWAVWVRYAGDDSTIACRRTSCYETNRQYLGFGSAKVRVLLKGFKKVWGVVGWTYA
jgi:RHS repeat-associated protein